MPQLLMQIDQIARQKQRDVLLLEWLTANDIPHYESGGYSSETLLDSYRGQIYIDVPYDKTDPVFQKVESFLKHPDGRMKFGGHGSAIFPLEVCMKNAHHDLPGFLEYFLEKY